MIFNSLTAAVDNSRQVNRNDLVLLLPYIPHRGKVINFNSASKELNCVLLCARLVLPSGDSE